MQDITDLAFWRLIASYGAPDVYYTEYFRVYPGSHLIKTILRSVTENPTGRPAVAQMIGNDIPALVRTARELLRYPIAGIDLNLGCPAPIVYRKCAGGGLLRNLRQVDAMLAALRDTIQTVPFTIKTRLGFDSAEHFPELLAIFAKHSPDLVTVHGRTVAEKYRSEVHYDQIALAAATLRCPVLANGNVISATKAASILATTGARGLMIGRGAIRNPWIFRQVRQHLAGESVLYPCGRDVLDYLHRLFECACSPDARESSQVQRLKKYLNFIGLGVDSEGRFLHEIRRVTTRKDFFQTCEKFLDHGDPMPLEPYALNLPPADLLASEHL